MLETAWESRWVPDPLKKSLGRVFEIKQTHESVLTHFSRAVLFYNWFLPVIRGFEVRVF